MVSNFASIEGNHYYCQVLSQQMQLDKVFIIAFHEIIFFLYIIMQKKIYHAIQKFHYKNYSALVKIYKANYLLFFDFIDISDMSHQMCRSFYICSKRFIQLIKNSYFINSIIFYLLVLWCCKFHNISFIISIDNVIILYKEILTYALVVVKV